VILTSTATDPESDTLYYTYLWTYGSGPVVVFFPGELAESSPGLAVYTAPTVTATHIVYFSIYIDDGHGNISTVGGPDLTVEP